MICEGGSEFQQVAEMPWRAAYLHPEASWKKMIPCLPCPTELQLDMRKHRGRYNEGWGTLRCLTFTNENRESNTDNSRTAHPPWLTFGLIYDIVEAAWFRSIPNDVFLAWFDYSYVPAVPSPREDKAQFDAAMKTSDVLSSDNRAVLQKYFQGHKQISGPGRVLVSLREDEPRTADEKARRREEAKAKRRKQFNNKKHKAAGPTIYDPPLEPVKSMVFTNEFYVQGGLTVADIDWDEVHEYGLPQRPATGSSDRDSRSLLSKLLWWKR